MIVNFKSIKIVICLLKVRFSHVGHMFLHGLVGARSKQDQKHGIPKELPVSGDSWWQLEKSDNPLDG